MMYLLIIYCTALAPVFPNNEAPRHALTRRYILPYSVGSSDFIQQLEFLEELKRNKNIKKETLTLKDIIDFHYRFKRIHHFQDGNGILPPFDVPSENFMAYKIRKDAPSIQGIVKYADEFGIE